MGHQKLLVSKRLHRPSVREGPHAGYKTAYAVFLSLGVGSYAGHTSQTSTHLSKTKLRVNHIFQARCFTYQDA